MFVLFPLYKILFHINLYFIGTVKNKNIQNDSYKSNVFQKKKLCLSQILLFRIFVSKNC